VRAGEGCAVTEAPRGILYHHYRIDAGGLLTHARICAPTSQNQKAIENDLRAYVQAHVHDSPESLQSMCERTIRNYDPCISCATHFLKIHWERTAQERVP
jgi:coenzyme F420-reducing hydrogenase alpha subunit